MRKNPLTKIEIALAERLREAREAAGFSRPLLARRAGMDSSRIVKYEHALVAIPYHIGARLFAELGVSQRWAMTGAGPREGYVKVLPEIEKLIPRAMSFAEGYQRMLADDISEQLQRLAELGGVSIEQAARDCALQPIGEHPRSRSRHAAVSSMHWNTSMVVQLCSPAEVDGFVKMVAAESKALLKKHKTLHDPDQEKREREEVVRVFAAKLAGWLPPGHARRKKC